MRATGIPAIERNPAPVIAWSALDLSNVRTGYLRTIDLARIPVPAAQAIRAALAERRQESRMA